MTPVAYSGAKSGLKRFLWVSFVVHGLIAAGLILAVDRAPPVDLDAAVVKTRLVKLGKKRDEKLLPRLERKRPPPKKKKLQVEKKVEPPPAPEKKPQVEKKPPPEPTRSTDDILRDFNDEKEEEPRNIDDLIHKTLGEPLEDGDETGSRLGEQALGRLKATYNDQLLAHIRAHFTAPTTLTEEERIRLRAEVYLEIGGEGALIATRISASSGNAVYDNAALSAVKRGAPFPKPPADVRGFYAGGVRVNLCPTSCP